MSMTWMGGPSPQAAAAVLADCTVLERSSEMLRHTTASAPASAAARNASSKAPGEGHAVWGSSSVAAIRA